MRRRFFWGMVSVAIITVVVGGIAAGVLINRSVEDAARSEFIRQASATARLIEAALPGSGAQGDDSRGRFAEILRTAELVGGHEFVEAAVVGPLGGIAMLGDDAGLLMDQVPGLADLTTAISFDAEIDGERIAAVAQPFHIGGRGTLVVVIGTRLSLIPWSSIVGRVLWALTLGVLLSAVVAGWLSNFAGRRLRRLRDATREVAGGDMGVRIEVEGSDEVAEVSHAFNEMAVRLDEARRREREFLVSVGHDLRTPLTTIAGYAEAIQEGRVSRDDLDRVAGVLGSESDRLRRLVEDLMLLSRIEAREFSLRPEAVDLTGHLGGLLEGFRGRADAAHISVVGDLEPVGDIVVDPDRIGQVVANLLENAMRYTPESGRVLLRLRRGNELTISVVDNGPGIEPADLPHVFERLYVATRYRPVRPEGSGLGLSIVSQLVAAMGGRCSVESTPGSGTEITVHLPLVGP